MVTVILSLLSLFSHCVLYHQAPTSTFYCCSPSSHSFQTSLTSQPILGLPHLRFPSTIWASDLFANFSSTVLFHMSGPFQPTPHRCLVLFPFNLYFPRGCCRSVTDPRDGKRVALKKMPNVFQNLISCKRVYRELKMLCHFKNDNVST